MNNESSICDDDRCVVCQSLFIDPIKLKCGHRMCKNEYDQLKNCPLCRGHYSKSDKIDTEYILYLKNKYEKLYDEIYNETNNNKLIKETINIYNKSTRHSKLNNIIVSLLNNYIVIHINEITTHDDIVRDNYTYEEIINSISFLRFIHITINNILFCNTNNIMESITKYIIRCRGQEPNNVIINTIKYTQDEIKIMTDLTTAFSCITDDDTIQNPDFGYHFIMKKNNIITEKNLYDCIIRLIDQKYYIPCEVNNIENLENNLDNLQINSDDDNNIDTMNDLGNIEEITRAYIEGAITFDMLSQNQKEYIIKHLFK